MGNLGCSIRLKVEPKIRRRKEARKFKEVDQEERETPIKFRRIGMPKGTRRNISHAKLGRISPFI